LSRGVLRHSMSNVLDWHFKLAVVLSLVCLPISLLANGWRDTLLMAVVIAPALFLIWWGDWLSEPDAGSLLTAPLYKGIVGGVLMFFGWVLLARLLGAMVIAPLFQLAD
jgi:hypothetical protein